MPNLRILGFIQSGFETKISHTRCEHTINYTTDVMTTTTFPVIKSNGQIWKFSYKNVDFQFSNLVNEVIWTERD